MLQSHFIFVLINKLRVDVHICRSFLGRGGDNNSTNSHLKTGTELLCYSCLYVMLLHY